MEGSMGTPGLLCISVAPPTTELILYFLVFEKQHGNLAHPPESGLTKGVKI